MQRYLTSFGQTIFDVRFVNAIFCGLWIISLGLCWTYSYNDPSSIFFQPQEAYKPVYTSIRENEADSFLSTLDTHDISDNWSSDERLDGSYQAGQKSYCLGIPSVQRAQGQFLNRSLASLTDTLSKAERSKIYIVVLLADENPTDHAAFGQPWLEALSDIVLVRNKSAKALVSEYHHYSALPLLPHGLSRHEKMRRDYTALINTCRQRRATHFILIEDDTIASRSWFSHVDGALPLIDDHASKFGQDWLYLRLFFSEKFLGWNVEEWPIYVKNICKVYAVVLAILVVIQYLVLHLHKASFGTRRKLWSIQVTILFIWLPMFIGLYFMAGRLSMNPFPAGVHEMPQYGCCSQGLVIPSRHLADLEATLMEQTNDEACDTVIENFADTRKLTKWALVPSVLQHVGVRGSSANGAKKSTWNFNFEKQQ